MRKRKKTVFYSVMPKVKRKGGLLVPVPLSGKGKKNTKRTAHLYIANVKTKSSHIMDEKC